MPLTTLIHELLKQGIVAMCDLCGGEAVIETPVPNRLPAGTVGVPAIGQSGYRILTCSPACLLILLKRGGQEQMIAGLFCSSEQCHELAHHPYATV